jgi:hypothetical protein
MEQLINKICRNIKKNRGKYVKKMSGGCAGVMFVEGLILL